MAEEKAGLLTGEEVIGARRRRVEISLGTVLVRSLGFRGLTGMLGQLMDVASLSEDARELQASGSDAQAKKDFVTGEKMQERLPVIEKVVAAGCVQPRFGEDPAAGPVVSDLPIDDLFTIFNAIVELSGFTKQSGDSVRP
jgi:hypothetical protein